MLATTSLVLICVGYLVLSRTDAKLTADSDMFVCAAVETIEDVQHTELLTDV